MSTCLGILPCQRLTSCCSITSYGDRANEYDAVVAYFKAHFAQVHRRNNESNRVLFTHLTSVVVRVAWFVSKQCTG